uniref:Uncharacterized protein n=1 Tax=Arundo donax TaxID=35708 RepID=A0A0A9EY54_ARUDO
MSVLIILVFLMHFPIKIITFVQPLLRLWLLPWMKIQTKCKMHFLPFFHYIFVILDLELNLETHTGLEDRALHWHSTRLRMFWLPKIFLLS